MQHRQPSFEGILSIRCTPTPANWGWLLSDPATMANDLAVDLHTLFWQTIPICVRRADKDEAPQELNVRVLTGCNRGDGTIQVCARLFFF